MLKSYVLITIDEVYNSIAQYIIDDYFLEMTASSSSQTLVLLSAKSFCISFVSLQIKKDIAMIRFKKNGFSLII